MHQRHDPCGADTQEQRNNNMKDVRVHYYVDNVCAWQDLPHSLSGWHAADGSGNSNKEPLPRVYYVLCIQFYG